ncbi:Nif3-like dinuclear metal center hexameric protein [Robertkochia sediminum]|uniref:Nif3-like dinuclear metal center hexameric protein n=1 Tax=Robertkochia sediminum TaxID=2785326 RepID=UPI001932795D|nr:Nif3-like dinuclear metal center hexameric protein [Robertkochia sediminum]MBL7471663.1 Nif3-like dinuclear metal center hexameric protein [Robertkochia sediminum]
MTIKQITDHIEAFAPLPYAEDFDNVGLLVGNAHADCTGVLVSLDTLEAVVDEAIEKACNLIVSFHPIIFSGLKKITGKTYVERVVLKAIRNDIAIYAIHTALDNSFEGVNARICDVLGLSNKKVLIPQKATIKKLTTFVPVEHAEKLRQALFEAGAGNIGNYSHCSFNLEGDGTFKGEEGADPVYGKKGEVHTEKEVMVGVTYARHTESQVLQGLFKAHPYEEVAYEIHTLENTNQHIGIGMTGTFEAPMEETTFLDHVKSVFKTGCVRHSALRGKPVKKVAVLGGSGAFGIGNALAAGADAYITGDLKYHDFYKAEGKILLADPGHFETEQYTKELLVEHLRKKIPNFAIVLSVCNTNPVKYL